MVGHVELDGEVLATLDDRGVWQPTAKQPLFAKLFNASFSPAHSEIGDHHFAFGEAALGRAADSVGGRAVYETPRQPLPPGCVS